jgi:hypothetical protein
MPNTAGKGPAARHGGGSDRQPVARGSKAADGPLALGPDWIKMPVRLIVDDHANSRNRKP